MCEEPGVAAEPYGPGEPSGIAELDVPENPGVVAEPLVPPEPGVAAELFIPIIMMHLDVKASELTFTSGT